jgi:hypothetical protein
MSAATKRPWLRYALALAIAAAGIAVLVVLVDGVLASRPQWVLIAENQSDGLRVRIVTTKSDEPTYEILMQGQNLPTAPLRLAATDAEGQMVGVTTLFKDHTLGPGRWVFTIDGVHIDCQPVRIIVNGTEYSPNAKITVNPSQETKYVPPRGY